MSKNLQLFSPLAFLASLGAGGISVIPFAIFQYTVPNVKGLITYSQMQHGTYPLWQEILYRGLEGVMILFVILHFILSFHFLFKFLAWRKTEAYSEMMADPNRNMAILAPFISLIMTMNTFLAGIRFFVPILSQNIQQFMAPAFVVWMIIWITLIVTVLKLLKIAFTNNFDVRKISFGWLLYPFALSMLAVTGTGFAAVAKSSQIAHAAALFSMVPLTMAILLFVVKIVTIFTNHFKADNLPEKQFMPSFLSVVPIVTLLSISFFRLGHYLHNHLNFHMESFYFWVVVGAYAFEIWYLMFGLTMLKSYFRNDFFKREYYLSQWALVCPFVAFAVLGAFTYKAFIPSQLFVASSIVSTMVAIGLFSKLLYQHFLCSSNSKVTLDVNQAYHCS